jgi:hypothetical protein
MLRKTVVIFFVAFATNYVWEHLHSLLYTSYHSHSITELVLLRASLVDAILILLITLPFLSVKSSNRGAFFIIPVGILVGILIELWALNTGQWQYTQLMPIIPFIQTGLTPTLQLGILGYVAYRIANR